MTLRPIDGRPKPEPVGVAGGEIKSPFPQSEPILNMEEYAAARQLRTHMAAQILAGFAAASRGGTAEQVVTAAYEWADKLLEKA